MNDTQSFPNFPPKKMCSILQLFWNGRETIYYIQICHILELRKLLVVLMSSPFSRNETNNGFSRGQDRKHGHGTFSWQAGENSKLSTSSAHWK